MMYFSMQITAPEELSQPGYQVADDNGNVSLVDIDGNPITLPLVYEYKITSPELQFPSWAS